MVLEKSYYSTHYSIREPSCRPQRGGTCLLLPPLAPAADTKDAGKMGGVEWGIVGGLHGVNGNVVPPESSCAKDKPPK